MLYTTILACKNKTFRDHYIEYTDYVNNLNHTDIEDLLVSHDGYGRIIFIQEKIYKQRCLDIKIDSKYLYEDLKEILRKLDLFKNKSYIKNLMLDEDTYKF